MRGYSNPQKYSSSPKALQPVTLAGANYPCLSMGKPTSMDSDGFSLPRKRVPLSSVAILMVVNNNLYEI